MNRPGVYIHIPFCRARCSYCDFATGTYEGALAERYVRAVAREIEAFDLAAPRAEVDTVYFGGGTPSLLSSAQASRILDAVRRRFNVNADSEVTLEMNPGTSLSIRRGRIGAQAGSRSSPCSTLF